MGQCLSSPGGNRTSTPGDLVLSSAITDPNITDSRQEHHDQRAQQEPYQNDRFLVVAIDFGTTYTGYAFSFRHEYSRDRLKISTNMWTNSAGLSEKAPTAVLLDKNQQLVSFGYDALRDYADLTEANKQTKFFLFSRFKMSLYTDQNLRANSMLTDIRGKHVPAIVVFSAVITYLRAHALDRIRGIDNQMSLEGKHVHWVVTVPAIWNDKAKQFMRRAAEKAGIEADRLTLALEPEAASLYCRYVPVYNRRAIHQSTEDLTRPGADTPDNFDNFGAGTTYMILDLGGGTVDVTVHIVKENGTLQELHQPSGGYWGGTLVDAEFSNLIIRILGDAVMMRAHIEYPQEMLELMSEFEVKKRVFKSGQTMTVQIKIPACLFDLYTEMHDVSFAEGLAKSEFKDKLSLKRDKLVLTAELFESLFASSLSHIVGHLIALLNSEPVSSVSTILLVGGYSESPIVKDNICRVFPHIRVINPSDASSAVLKGAVLFGHEPFAIASRVCKSTYGIAMQVPFNPDKHSSPTCRVVDGLVDDVFDVHLRVGDTATVGADVVEKFYFIPAGSVYAILDVYMSSNHSPTFVTEPGCTKLGTVTVQTDSVSTDRDVKISVRLVYRGTELSVEAREVNTGKLTKSQVDFLG
ncbi:heat shock 70 kDa protein 12A-like [Mizuhopecten yessoensis]|uniref:Heat shock 70 kDa protein n=1 Tax=Mizuhopecten yessoensis TaxID=6573 RepID=A0A1C9U2V7_MIZYE|nr:heat shock 70 kDa protein 12A-like [Mizuhopecten yessoensis]AOR17332.1 heat shock 70 kDa protein [Mizuhopecten yessoensis]OWF55325.1 Heat shock 70 kDa protein 12A [Mizuhopecten yessoensis]